MIEIRLETDDHVGQEWGIFQGEDRKGSIRTEGQDVRIRIYTIASDIIIKADFLETGITDAHAIARKLVGG
jgi:hypothetical protein